MSEIVPVAERPFEDLVALNAPVIHRTIVSYAGSADLSYEDLRQEMLVTMWECQQRFRWGGKGGQHGLDRQFFYYLQSAMRRRLFILVRATRCSKRSATLVPLDTLYSILDDTTVTPYGDGIDALTDQRDLSPETATLVASLSPGARTYLDCRLGGVRVADRLSRHDAQIARRELESTFGSGE